MRANTIAGFVLAPLAAPVSLAATFVIAWALHADWFADRSLQTLLGAIFLFAMYAPFFAYPVAIILGIPAYVIARRRKWLTLSQSIAIGIVVALTPLLAYFAYVAVEDGPYVVSELRDAGWWMLLFALSGGSSGAAFWWIALRRATSSPTHDS